MDQLDDYENRDCHQNIRIRGLPEIYHTTDLLATVENLFNQIMEETTPESMEVDRVHRVTPANCISIP